MSVLTGIPIAHTSLPDTSAVLAQSPSIHANGNPILWFFLGIQPYVSVLFYHREAFGLFFRSVWKEQDWHWDRPVGYFISKLGSFRGAIPRSFLPDFCSLLLEGMGNKPEESTNRIGGDDKVETIVGFFLHLLAEIQFPRVFEVRISL